MIFTPTWLMIKQHKATGLKYFCKTISADPVKYPGSGLYWTRHLLEHGKHVETLWCQLFKNIEEIFEFATNFSISNNIVKAVDINGNKIWANLVNENGIDGGGNAGLEMLQCQKEKLSDTWEVKTPSGEVKIVTNISKFCKEHSLNASAMSSVARGNRSNHKGYWCRKIVERRNVSYEYKSFVPKPFAMPKTAKVRKGGNHPSARRIVVNGIQYYCVVDAMRALSTTRFKVMKLAKV